MSLNAIVGHDVRVSKQLEHFDFGFEVANCRLACARAIHLPKETYLVTKRDLPRTASGKALRRPSAWPQHQRCGYGMMRGMRHGASF